MSLGLGDIRRQNSKLLTLNLSNNLIGDDGAVSLARVLFTFHNNNNNNKHKTNKIYLMFFNSFKGLRTNRSLIVLNLSNNNIGDVGAKAFAEVGKIVQNEKMYLPGKN